MVLTETKVKGKGQERIGKYIHIWSGVDRSDRARAGVSILVSNKYSKKIKNIQEVSERFIVLEVEMLGTAVTVIGVYAPTNNERQAVKDAFEDQLTYLLERVKNKN